MSNTSAVIWPRNKCCLIWLLQTLALFLYVWNNYFLYDFDWCSCVTEMAWINTQGKWIWQFEPWKSLYGFTAYMSWIGRKSPLIVMMNAAVILHFLFESAIGAELHLFLANFFRLDGTYFDGSDLNSLWGSINIVFFYKHNNFVHKT